MEITMPITNFELVGEWGSKSPKRKYKQVDINILTNDKAVNKIHRKFSRTKHKFNFIFLRSKLGAQYLQQGVKDQEWVETNLGIKYTPDDDAINVIYTNNVGTEHVPMTAWMIAHRLSHAMFNKRHRFYNKYEQALITLQGWYDNGLSYRDRFYGLLPIVYSLGTMRSVRHNNLVHCYEFVHEMVAQYLINGKITLQPAQSRIIKKRHFAWGNPNHSYLYLQKNIDLDDFQVKIDTFKDTYTDIIQSNLVGMVGSTLIM